MRRTLPADPDALVSLLPNSTTGLPSEAPVLVRDALRALPEPQRRAIVLATIAGLTAAEISEVEDIPLGTAKTRIRTGLAKLRALVAEAPE